MRGQIMGVVVIVGCCKMELFAWYEMKWTVYLNPIPKQAGKTKEKCNSLLFQESKNLKKKNVKEFNYLHCRWGCRAMDL